MALHSNPKLTHICQKIQIHVTFSQNHNFKS
uniref:Uncharacterized protein n=1 Tax=Anguilla anguilla TaxID=7936 RepID=A0A0E9T5F2_ANGAN